jgi:hypothetical protein
MVFILSVNNLCSFCRKGDKIHSPTDITVISNPLQSLCTSYRRFSLQWLFLNQTNTEAMNLNGRVGGHETDCTMVEWVGMKQTAQW